MFCESQAVAVLVLVDGAVSPQDSHSIQNGHQDVITGPGTTRPLPPI